VRAVVYDRYGPPEVLHLEEVAKPAPRDDELLVRVRATTVNRLDCHTREANMTSGPVVSAISRLVSGVRAPRQRILGSELAGEVEATGAAVRDFKAGDRVFGLTGLRFGGYAEYTCVRESARVTHMPSTVTFEEAAATPDGGMNALWSLGQVRLRPGMSVLVYGASGSIGTAGVQLARHLGADVTGVTSTKNVELVRSLGAGEVIDYTKDDFTKNGKTYDVVFDAVGKHSFERSKGSLKPGGYYLATDGFRNLWLGPWTALFGEKKVSFTIPPRYPKQDLQLLKDLLEKGEYRPVIDRRYPMEQVVEAHRYVDTQQKVGNVVLLIG
jgi:NADPH:quinone reductase-like Zn-dependent oxidoreductase